MTMNYIEFIETSVFSRQREALLTEDEFRAFQEMLIIKSIGGRFNSRDWRLQEDPLRT